MRQRNITFCRIRAALLLPVLLSGVVWAQDVKPVTPEPLERDIGERDPTVVPRDDDVPEEPAPAADTTPVDSEPLERETGAAEKETGLAVAREPLERNLDGTDEGAEEAAADAPAVFEMVLGALNGGGQDGFLDVQANLRPFMPALNQALTIEIHYLRKVCNPDEQQLKVIRAAGEKKIVELAKIVARNQHQAFTSDEQGGRGPLQKALLASAKEVLPAEKYERYQQELEQRQAARLRGACEMMTLHLDNTLSFPIDDYDKVVDILTENPQPQWTQTMQTFFYREYCPLPARALIQPVLNERQQKIWSRMPSRNGGIMFGWPANIGLQQWGLNLQLKELDDYSREVDDE